MPKSHSSRQWLDRHVNDEYVKRSIQDGYRSRAVYKLQEINDKDNLFKPGQIVVDLGCAPGAWCQMARDLVGDNGVVIGLDILPTDPIGGVDLIQGDFREDSTYEELNSIVNGRKLDLVISDIAPNVTGVTSVDQPSSIYLCELALAFAQENLKPNGAFVVKVFQGEGFDAYVKAAKDAFKRVVIRKPKASRAKSREVYLVAENLKL